MTGPLAAMGRRCAVHFHREDVPLETHHIWPTGKGGPDTAANRVVVCANGHGAIHALLLAMDKDFGRLPWRVRRRFGLRVRRLAHAGWVQYGSPPPT